MESITFIQGRRPVLLVVLLGVVVAGAACAASTPMDTGSGEQGVSISRTDAPYESLADLYRDAKLVVAGEVMGEATGVAVHDDTLVPAVDFKVSRSLKGDRLQPESLTVRYTRLAGYPTLDEGASYLLFLDHFIVDPEDDDDTGEFVVLGVFAGMYRENSDGDRHWFERLDDGSPGLPEKIDSSDIEDLNVEM